jgi:endo-1,4-beta-xylanase
MNKSQHLIEILLIFFLVACTQSLTTPTPTKIPTATNLPIKTLAPTNTLLPTPPSTLTSTPIPTLEGLSIPVPDPRISNPELFDLEKQDAPIPQFINAMKMEGIEVTGEQVNQGITYQELKYKDGNPFVVAAYNYDPDPAKTGEPLEGPIPLAIAQKNGKGDWGWEESTIGKIATIKNKIVRLACNIFMLNSHNNEYDQTVFLFNGFTSPDGHWYIPYSAENSIRPDINTFNFQTFDEKFYFINKKIKNILFLHLLWGYEPVLPNWLLKGNFTEEQYKTIAENHIKEVINHYREQVSKYVVVNEAWGNPWEDFSKFWYKKLGPPKEWVPDMFLIAHEVDPEAKLIFNDFGIEIPGNRWWNEAKEQQFFRIAKEMQQAGLPIEVGFQMHLYSADFAISAKFNQLINNYRSQIKKYRSAGILVNITEFDLIPEGVNPKDLDSLNAKITEAILQVSFEEGVKDFTFFGLAPNYAQYAVAFKSLGHPSLVYYVSEKVIFNLNQ